MGVDVYLNKTRKDTQNNHSSGSHANNEARTISTCLFVFEIFNVFEKSKVNFDASWDGVATKLIT
jgi:hypothetical protein